MTRNLVMACCVGLEMLSLMGCGKGKEEEATQEQGQKAVVASKLPAALQDELAAWKAVGGVIDIRDLAPKPPSPGARNAADVHRSIAGMLTGLSPSDEMTLADPWEAPVSSLKYLVEFYEDTLPKIHEAVSLPYCNWDLRVEDGNDADISHLSRLRYEARLLTAEAIVRADKSNFEGAAQSIVDIVRLGDQAAAESDTIGILVRNSFDAFAANAVRGIFKEREAVPAIIGQALSNREYRSFLRRALIFEGASAILMARKAAGGDVARPIEEQAIPPDLADGLAWNLRMLRSYIDESDQPYYTLKSAVQVTPMPLSARLPELHMTYELCDRLCKASASIETNTAIALLAIQLREHRAKHGEYPDPRNSQTPIDALTGQPIRYQKTSTGFVLQASTSGVRGESGEIKWEW